ncbi:MAG: branched-chain amino acid transporter AzlD [Clostridiales bacterium]|nr:branched-chain amino acid transporter AzlD [Clostridiales bacterium]
MTMPQVLFTVLLIAAATLLTRIIPFLLFPAGKEIPPFVSYLGAALPYAVIGMLVVYCFKAVSVLQAPHGAPEFLAAAFVVLAHKWRHNLLLSIGGGTALYMVLVQVVFA